jgi:hypothetical protein
MMLVFVSQENGREPNEEKKKHLYFIFYERDGRIFLFIFC